MFDEFKNCPPAPGFNEVMIPGEIENNIRNRLKLEGIDLSDVVITDLCQLALEYGLSYLLT
jgi:LDH2 family malate/lactate/ureidoglycolate dehydrogenase